MPWSTTTMDEGKLFCFRFGSFSEKHIFPSNTWIFVTFLTAETPFKQMKEGTHLSLWVTEEAFGGMNPQPDHQHAYPTKRSKYMIMFAQLIMKIYSSDSSESPVMKHLLMNSFSRWRCSLAWAFFKIFLRLVPRFPGEENLRMFSLFRLIFSFLALTRHPKSSVLDKADLPGSTVKAFANKWSKKRNTINGTQTKELV